MIGPPDPMDRHWGWFAGIFAVLAILGVVGAMLSLLPLAMATDGCHGDDDSGVCGLSAAGQNALVLIPWIALGVGSIVTIVGAAVAARAHRSPLIGLLVGVVAYVVVIPLAYRIAFLL